MLPALPARLRRAPARHRVVRGVRRSSRPAAAGVGYAPGGGRFLGATFDPSGLYRFVAVQRWLDALRLGRAAHPRPRPRAAGALPGRPARGRLARGPLLPDRDEGADRGNFLTFRLPFAGAVQARLAAQDVIVDHRGDRLRIGFGVYHDSEDVDELLRRVERAVAAP